MKKDPLKIQSHVILGMLILQYLFGTAANLFVQFPNSTSEKVLWQFAVKQFPLTVHMLLGVLLVIAGIVLLIRALRKKDRNWIWAASIGLFSILVASFAGAQFIPTQQDLYSYTMAIAFIAAFVAYGWGLYKAKSN